MSNIYSTHIGIIHYKFTALQHKAAGLLRSAIEGISFQSLEYAPSGELDVEKCKSFVPSILIDFISWCTSKRHFNNASSVSEYSSDSNLLRVLAICHNIIGLSCPTCTPISFGVGVQMHHDYGSKSLIDILHSTGYFISYDEVRRFETSVAEDQLSQSEIYVPQGNCRPETVNRHSIVDAAIDNFDANEDTLDGKSSTHSMATVLYQRSAEISPGTGICRSSSRSLDISKYNEPSIQPYGKPHKKPEPQRSPTATPFELRKDTSHYISSQLKDLIWLLTRNGEAQSISAWSGFNALLTDMSIPVTTIRYLPFIHAPPSDISNIYTTLLKLVTIAKHLGQPHILVTADLVIYSKTQQILWNTPEPLCGMVTMRLGAMHLIMAYISSIGKLFGDGGLQDILSSSGVFASLSTTALLQGKHYARGIRGLKIAYEAMMHLYLSSLETYAKANNLPWLDEKATTVIKELALVIQERDDANLRTIYADIASQVSRVMETISKFKEYGRKQSATFAYWDNFLDAIGILLRLMRADREANFLLHLDAVLEVIPFFHLAGKIN